MITVQVDFNSRARNGLVKASLRSADGPVEVGDRVIAADRAEGLEFEATVHSIDDETGHLYLQPSWESAPSSLGGVELAGASAALSISGVHFEQTFGATQLHPAGAAHRHPWG